MELSEVMRTTGAVREFTADPVSDEVVRAVLDDARFAPSGGNRQGWHVIVVKDPALRALVRDACVRGWRDYSAFVAARRVPFAPGPDGRWRGVPDDVDLLADPLPNAYVDTITDVPVLMLLVGDLTQFAITDVETDRTTIVGGASIYPFAQNVLLAARDAGLGGVFSTFVCRGGDELRDALGLPSSHVFAGMWTLGRPVRQPTRLRRKPVEEFTTVDRFTGPPL